MFLFPYENIKKDSNVIIYGAGTMGTDYILQVQRTEFCNIIFALDRSANEKVGFPVNVYMPEYIKNVEPNRYDYVLVALQDVNHSANIKQTLLDYGVEETKIVQAYEVGLNCAGFFPKPEYTETDNNPEFLHLAFYAYGGMGDTLLATALIKAVRKMVKKPLKIDYYCNCPDVYKEFPFIDNVFKLTQFSDSYDYDFSAFVFRNINFQKINLEKIKRFSKTLYQWCIDAIRINEKICDNFRDDCRYSLYAAMKGRNRIEQHNINGILPYDRHTPVYMEWDLDAYANLEKFGLAHKRYITICSGIENCNTMRNPKLWDIEKYNKLVSMIKNRFPNLLVVNIGQNYNFGKIEGTDIDIVGKTTLNDVKVVLKQSILHIGVEGGLVHLNHFLYGKSCCMFGATSKEFFGYDENINVNSGFPKQCSNGCEGIVFNWMSYGCFLDNEPLCMKSLSAEQVFESIGEYLEELPEFSYEVLAVRKVNEFDKTEILKEMVTDAKDIAIINRTDNDVMDAFMDMGKDISVFDRDLGEEDEFINCYYSQRYDKIGIEVEYGNIYNIPLADNSCDTLVNFTLADEEYPEYALKEMLRVMNESGTLILCCKQGDVLRKILSDNNVVIQNGLEFTERVIVKIKKYRV